MNNGLLLRVAVLALIVVGTLHAADADKPPLGPVQLELNDKSIVKGVLLDMNDEVVSLRTKDGDFRYERKNVKRIDQIAATGQPPKGGPEVIKQKASLKELAAEADEAAAVADQEIGVRAKPKEAEKKPAMQAENDQNILRLLKNNKNAPSIQPKKLVVSRGQLVIDPSAPKPYEQAIRMIEARQFKNAAALLREFVAKSGDDEINKAESLCRDTFSLSLPEMMVRCYMNDMCAGCKGDGVVACVPCNGVGYTISYSNRIPGMGPQPGLRRSVMQMVNSNVAQNVAVKGNESRRVTICDRCRGNGYDPCGACHGTRINLVEPTPFEREAYSSRLMTLGSEVLNKSETGFGESQREPPPSFWSRGSARMKPMMEQVWLRDSLGSVKSDIMRMCRAEAFYSKALEADPTLVLRSNKDMQQEITRIRSRKLHLYGELNERFQVYAQNRIEHMLDELEFSENFGGAQKPERVKFAEILSDE